MGVIDSAASRFAVPLAQSDAAAPEAAAQLCGSLTSLGAAADGVFDAVEARVASQRGASLHVATLSAGVSSDHCSHTQAGYRR